MTLLTSQSVLKAQNLICLSPKGAKLVANVYSDNLKKKRAITLKKKDGVLPEFALLSPNSKVIALGFTHNWSETKENRLEFLDFRTGRQQRVIFFPLGVVVWGGRWADNDTFNYFVRYTLEKTRTWNKKEKTHFQDSVKFHLSTQTTQVLERSYATNYAPVLETPYYHRAKKAAEWFEQLKIPAALVHMSSSHLGQLGWHGGTGLGAVAKDGKTAVSITTAEGSRETNNLMVVVQEGKLHGKVPLPSNLDEAMMFTAAYSSIHRQLGISGNYITFIATQNKKDWVFVWRLSDLKFLGRLDEQFVMHEGEE